MKILVVDDSKTSQMLLDNFLRCAGYEDILLAESYDEAICILCNGYSEIGGSDVDLILMDIVMPVTDGIDATIKIKSNEKFKDIPVIMVTVKDEDNSLERAFEAGAIDYINKPINQIELRSRVNSILKLKEEMDRRKLREKELVREIEERKKLQEQMAYIANHDSLTGMPNRFSFNKHLYRALERANRHNEILAILIIDLDHFKNVNDSLGHNAGDLLLIEASQRMRKCLREPDILARIGGDEFYIILENIKRPEFAADIADRIVVSLSQKFYIGENKAIIGSSIGIAIFPNDDKDPDSLIRKGDIAMYQAKLDGRNRHKFFSSSMDKTIIDKVKLIEDVRGALERNEFRILYQPLLDIRNHSIIGVEALLRWLHPEKGLILPANFIPILEETGLIVPVGEWVLRQTFLQHKKWLDKGIPPIKLSVNFSPIQFKDNLLADKIKRIIGETQFDPSLLEVEITESLSMIDDQIVKNMLNKIKDIGIDMIIMDNFGIGNASLNYLKNFPINGIKIEKSFVQGIVNNHVNASIVNAIVALALGLKFSSIVAEGVETNSQLEILRQMGCNYYQGFLFSKPVSEDEIERKMGCQ